MQKHTKLAMEDFKSLKKIPNGGVFDTIAKAEKASRDLLRVAAVCEMKKRNSEVKLNEEALKATLG